MSLFVQLVRHGSFWHHRFRTHLTVKKELNFTAYKVGVLEFDVVDLGSFDPLD